VQVPRGKAPENLSIRAEGVPESSPRFKRHRQLARPRVRCHYAM